MTVATFVTFGIGVLIAFVILFTFYSLARIIHFVLERNEIGTEDGLGSRWIGAMRFLGLAILFVLEHFWLSAWEALARMRGRLEDRAYGMAGATGDILVVLIIAAPNFVREIFRRRRGRG